MIEQVRSLVFGVIIQFLLVARSARPPIHYTCSSGPFIFEFTCSWSRVSSECPCDTSLPELDRRCAGCIWRIYESPVSLELRTYHNRYSQLGHVAPGQLLSASAVDPRNSHSVVVLIVVAAAAAAVHPPRPPYLQWLLLRSHPLPTIGYLRPCNRYTITNIPIQFRNHLSRQ